MAGKDTNQAVTVQRFWDAFKEGMGDGHKYVTKTHPIPIFMKLIIYLCPSPILQWLFWISPTFMGIRLNPFSGKGYSSFENSRTGTLMKYAAFLVAH
jgi:hypothetical protein